MKVDTSWVIGLLKHLLGQQAEALVRKRMTDAQDSVANGMKAKGLNAEAGVGVCAHDAAFRLWKAVVRSGDVSDLLRDRYDTPVRARVEALFPHGAGSVAAIVTETMNATLAEVFGG